MIVGLIMTLCADCEVLEVVVVQTLSPAAHGIGLCEATFAYHPKHSSAPLAGTLVTPCPTDVDNYSDVAVCFAVGRPDKYTAALLASDLTVTRKSVPLGLLIAGSTVLICSTIGTVLMVVVARRAAARRNHDDLPLLPIATGQDRLPIL